MQDDPNRLSQKSDTSAQLSREDLLSLARSAVADALILMPKIRAADLAEALLNNRLDFQPALNDLLAREYYVHLCYAERLRQALANRAQLLLPGFEHLPLKVKGPKGKLLPLLDANYTCVRAYYRSLTTGHDARKNNDPRVKECKALLEKMARRCRTEKRITVREVVLIDQD